MSNFRLHQTVPFQMFFFGTRRRNQQYKMSAEKQNHAVINRLLVVANARNRNFKILPVFSEEIRFLE